MILWNYGPDVMDALLELILSLVCRFYTLPKRVILEQFGEILYDYLSLYCITGCFKWELS